MDYVFPWTFIPEFNILRSWGDDEYVLVETNISTRAEEYWDIVMVSDVECGSLGIRQLAQASGEAQGGRSLLTSDHHHSVDSFQSFLFPCVIFIHIYLP